MPFKIWGTIPHLNKRNGGDVCEVMGRCAIALSPPAPSRAPLRPRVHGDAPLESAVPPAGPSARARCVSGASGSSGDCVGL